MFQWGFLGVFKADNGAPFGDPSRQALSPLNLHLTALGIRTKLNPPRSPTKNAKVERNQGTTSRWANATECSDCLEFQQRIDQAVLDQRENYPTRVCQGQTRAEKYPALFTNPKRFHPEDFDINRVYSLLAKGSWRRKVSAQGVVTIFSKEIQVGYKHRGTIVTATFNPEQIAWQFKNDRGDILKTQKADNLLLQNILTFSLRQ